MNSCKTIKDKKKQNASAMRIAAFEALEQRQLMSVSWNAGAITINGSNANDTIVVDYQDFQPGFSMIRVRENGATTQNWTLYQNSKGLTVYGNAGNDTIDLSAVKFGAVVFGGTNNDTIKGTQAGDALYGNDGDDTVYGNGGNDVVDGGANDDTLVGGGGADALWGGAGVDTASYAERTAPVYVSLDGAANDGESLEQDNAHTDVENIVGGTGDDILTGSSAANYIQGNGGSDVIHGLGDKDTLFGGMAYGNAVKNNNGTDQLFGDAGDDNLWAPGSGRAIMHGGANNDSLFGSAKNDDLYGDGGDDSIYAGAGNDNLFGGAGNDWLYAGDGDDNLYGGIGTDHLFGGDGNDVLVAIGGGTNSTLHGDGNTDTFWLDNYADEQTDATPGELAAKHEHRVAGFASAHYAAFQNGQLITTEVAVGIDPLGEDLPDPAAPAGSMWANFSGHSLFGVNGPQADDINQGDTGDCWFLSSLSMVARKNADQIRQRIVPMGDGTFAVRFGDGGTEQFVRVDGQLPIDALGTPIFAKEGMGHATWVALMEKAEALSFKALSGYEQIDHGTHWNALAQLGGQAMDWSNWTGFSNGGEVLSKIDKLLGDGYVVGFGTFDYVDTISDAPVVGDHAYSVVAVNKDKNGKPVSLVLRNPWSHDGFNKDANPQDGYVTITAQEAFVALQDLTWAKV